MLKVLIGLTIVCALFVSEGVVAQENDENLPLQYLKMHTLRELIVKMGEEPNTVVVSSSTSSKIGLVTTKPVSNEIRAEFRKTIQQKVDSLPAWLMNLDANQFTLALRGAQALLDRIESGKTIEDISCGMAVRIRLMEGVSSRIVVLGETLPKTGRFLTMDMKGKERASAIIQSLQKSFPEFKEKLAEIKLPITYGDIYAIQRLGKDPNGWPDIRPIGAVCYLRDPEAEISKTRMSLSGFAELFLWYEFHQQRSQIIVDLSDKMGLIPSDKSGIKVAAAKYVEAIKRGDTIPYMGTTVTPDIAWKACGDARGRWQIFSGASATSKTSR